MIKKIISGNKQKFGWQLLIGLMVVVPVVVFLQAPIAQDPNYHLFEDVRIVFGINNFSNVISNIPFLLVGMAGLYKILISQKLSLVTELKWSYSLLYFGLVLVAFGSGYYHLTPNNQTLLWDRLPMTISFMALLSVLAGEFISVKVGKILLLPLILIGITSVLTWYFGEQKNAGDLRFYVLVQFIPVLSIPIILSCFQSVYNNTTGYWWLLVAYVAAKFLEYFDAEIFDLLGIISGHSLKHLMAASGMLLLLNYFEIRQPSKF